MITGSLPAAGLAPAKAQKSAGLTDGRLPAWMPDRVCGKKVVNDEDRRNSQTAGSNIGGCVSMSRITCLANLSFYDLSDEQIHFAHH